MAYKTAAALEMAVRDAARSSKIGTNAAISNFYFHRLLCRVFSSGEATFILKGGMGLLARTLDARESTRDADLSTCVLSLDDAVEELKVLAEKDLEDFVTFRYERTEQIRVEDEYRDGCKVTFTVLIGAKVARTLSVDLVVDSIPCDNPDWITPADRLDINGLAVCDYPVFPVVRVIADKACGIVEKHNGRDSSRVKDLIDLVVLLNTEPFEAIALKECLAREAAMRGLSFGGGFAVPQSWHANLQGAYRKLASQSGLPSRFHSLSLAEEFVKSCIDAVVEGRVDDCAWVPESHDWEQTI